MGLALESDALPTALCGPATKLKGSSLHKIRQFSAIKKFLIDLELSSLHTQPTDFSGE